MRRPETLYTSQRGTPDSSPQQPYEIQMPPGIRSVLDKAPRRSRTAIERMLQEAARLAAMRQWMHGSEGQHPIQIQLAGYEGSYSLDPESRVLTLWHLGRR
jgi:hypothetical protein